MRHPTASRTLLVNKQAVYVEVRSVLQDEDTIRNMYKKFIQKHVLPRAFQSCMLQALLNHQS
jgi:hypothetical protein